VPRALCRLFWGVGLMDCRAGWPRGGAVGRCGIDLHRQGVHPAVPSPEEPAVDGPVRVVFRPRRRRGGLLCPGVGGDVPTHLHRPRPRPARRGRAVPRVLQHQHAPQRGCH